MILQKFLIISIQNFDVDFLLIPELHIDLEIDYELVNWKFKLTPEAKSISLRLKEIEKGRAKCNDQEKYVGKIL